MKSILLTILLVLAVAVSASAQSITNPTKVEYEPSADHAQMTKYVVGFFLVGATNPVQVVDLPIVAPDPGTGKITQTMPFASLTFGTYVAKLKSVAGSVEGEWSEPSNEGVRAPLPANAPIVKK